MLVLVYHLQQHIKNHLPKVNTITIGNAVPQFVQQADLAKTKELYRVIFVGRLAKQHKRPHLLIEAFIKIADKFPQWQLELWGAKDGEVYFKQLEEMISKAGMKQRIFIRGATDNVPAVLQEGDIFAFPSAFEGFGLSLAEAMSMGLPTIGYKSCSAVNELIKDGVNGFLCDAGVNAFADKLSILMNNQEMRIKMGAAARDSMKQYAPELIWDKWERLIKLIANEEGRILL